MSILCLAAQAAVSGLRAITPFSLHGDTLKLNAKVQANLQPLQVPS